MNMRLSWLMNGFICREFYTPFVVERDNGIFPILRIVTTSYSIRPKRPEQMVIACLSLRDIGKRLSRHFVATTKPML